MNDSKKGTPPPMSKLKICISEWYKKDGYLGIVFRYQGCIGICRGMTVVRRGFSGAGRFCATNAPRKTRGKSIRSHIQKSATMVPKGIAEDAFEAIRRKFRQRTDASAIPGTKEAVFGNEQRYNSILPSKR